MTYDRYPYLSDNVKAQIARGEVPPPRETTDPPDEVRDIKLALAIAQDEGDWTVIERLNVQWLDAQRAGRDANTWQPPEKEAGTFSAPTKAEVQRAARKAQEDGDQDRANALYVKAMHMPNDDGREFLQRAETLDEAGDHVGADRARAQAMAVQRGDDPNPPARPEPAPPMTREELTAAAHEAASRGDWDEHDRFNAQMMANKRQAMESNAPLQ